MGRIWFGLLLCVGIVGLSFAPLGCDTVPTNEQGTEVAPDDGGSPPENKVQTDSPQPRTCAPQGDGCCLTIKAVINWKAHEEQPRISADTWAGTASHSTQQLIAIADGDSRGIRLWDYSTSPKLEAMLIEHTEGVRSLAFHPTKSVLASGSKDKVIKLWDTTSREVLRTLKGHTSTIYTLAFFPKGAQLLSGSEDRSVRIWGVESGALIRSFTEPKGRINSVSVSSDGEYIAGASADGKIYIWEVRLNKLHKELSNGTPNSISFTRDTANNQELLVAGYSDGKVRVFEMPDGTLRYELKKEGEDKAHGRGVTAVESLPGKDFIATGDDEGMLRIWKISDGSFVSEKKAHSGGIRTLSARPNTSLVLSSATDGNVFFHNLPTTFLFRTFSSRIDDAFTIQANDDNIMYSSSRESKDIVVWDLKKKSILGLWKGHNNGITGLALSLDSKWLASAAEDGSIKLWDTQTGKVVKDLQGPKLPTRGLAFSPKGTHLVAASYDGKVRVWSLPGGEPQQTLDTNVVPLTHIVYSPSGKYVAAGADYGTTYVWTTSNWKQVHTLKATDHQVYSLAFTADEKFLLTGGRDIAIRWWDLSTGKETQSIEGDHNFTIRSIIIDDANKRLISTGDSRILIHTLPDNKLLHVIRGHASSILSMIYNPKTQQLLSYGAERVVRQWDLSALSNPDPIKAHDEKANTVAVSPDGKWIATGGEDKLVKIWDRLTSKLVHTLTAHTAAITDVAFSPDGKWLASASFDKTALLWDVLKGTKTQEFKGNLDRVYRVRFSPDSKFLATAGGDWSLRTWDVETGKQIKEMANHKQIVTSADWTPDGKQLLSASYDKTLRIWNTDGTEALAFPASSVGFSDAMFERGGARIITSSFDQNIRIWSIKDKRAVTTFKAHEQSVVAIDYHPQVGIITTSFDKLIKQWGLTGSLIRTFTGETSPPTDVAISPDGAFVYSVSEEGVLRAWPMLSPERANYVTNLIGLTHAAWSPDPDLYATASIDNTVKIWSLSTYKPETLYFNNDTLRLHWATTSPILAITIRNDGVRIVDGKTRKTIRDVKPQDKTDTFHDAVLSPNGEQLVTASEDGKVRTWDVASGKLSDILKGHEAPVTRVAFSPDGKILASADDTGLVKLWDIAKGSTTKSWQAHKDVIHNLTFDNTSKFLVTTSADYTAKVWSLDAEMRKELCLGQQILDAQFDPKGKWLAIGTFHGKVQIFQVSDWKLLQTIQPGYSTVQSISWSPEGDQLIGAFQNGELYRWEVKP